MMLSNYKEHPTKTNYLVFSYTNIYMVEYFMELLIQQNIPFVKDEEEFGENNVFMVAVKTAYRKEAVKSNFLAYGKYRKRTFSHRGLKYFLFIFLIGVILLAFLGYVNSKK